MLIKTLNLNKKKPWKKYNKIKTLNGHKIFIYDKHELKIHLINSCHFSLISDVEVIAVNVLKYDVILNLSWLQKYNSLIDWTNSIIKWSKNHVFKTSNIMFSNEEQSFFIIINKREKIANLIKTELKNITNGPQKNWKKNQHVCSTESPYENIVIFMNPNAKYFVENSQMNFVNFADIQFVNVKQWHWYKRKKEFQMYVLYVNYINEITNNLMNVLLKNEKQIFQCYHEYLDVFSKNKINELFVHDS